MKTDSGFGVFFWRISSSHMITYFLMGIVAVTLLDYKESFETPPLSYFMRPVSSPWVAAGPILQIFRGLILSLALWFFKDIFLFKPYGWLKLWGLIVGLSILSTAGPAPASVDGFIYTKIPAFNQLKGYIEVLPQTLLFSVFVCSWYENPKKRWDVLAIVSIIIIVALCSLGVIAAMK